VLVKSRTNQINIFQVGKRVQERVSRRNREEPGDTLENSTTIAAPTPTDGNVKLQTNKETVKLPLIGKVPRFLVEKGMDMMAGRPGKWHKRHRTRSAKDLFSRSNY